MADQTNHLPRGRLTPSLREAMLDAAKALKFIADAKWPTGFEEELAKIHPRDSDEVRGVMMMSHYLLNRACEIVLADGKVVDR